MQEKTNDSICLNCLYSSQPHGYFPIICVQGKRIKEMWEDKTECRHFEPCPSEEVEKQEPFNIIKCNI